MDIKIIHSNAYPALIVRIEAQDSYEIPENI
jgi:hypothetical protein